MSGFFRFERIIEFIASIPKQSTLKYLSYSAGDDGGHHIRERFTMEQATALLDLIKGNYSLEKLDISDNCFPDLKKEMDIIMRLNAAGRRYVVLGEESNVQAGIYVLSAVSDDLDCLFYHLRENPLILDSRREG
jgi:hypothetical protein